MAAARPPELERDEVTGASFGHRESPTHRMVTPKTGPIATGGLFDLGEFALDADGGMGLRATTSIYDEIAYSGISAKTEAQRQAIERRVMQRCFNSFDQLNTGKIKPEEVTKLCEFVGEGVDPKLAEEMQAAFAGKEITFDAFWQWWEPLPKRSRRAAYATLRGKFEYPFEVQQLFTTEEGEKFTPTYRMNFFFKNVTTGEVNRISPWHDIPLYVREPVRTRPEHVQKNRLNFICEIPKWTRAKFEIATGLEYNPIKQDMKNGVPRFYIHGDMMFNYGAFPQTWESTKIDFLESIKGDNDPLDAIEIGMTQLVTGSVTAVKVLGILGMIDHGEMDWKAIVISYDDPMARFLNDIEDVPKYLPGCLDAIREWLRVYKCTNGQDGAENKFAFDGAFKNKDYTLGVIKESHRMWSNLTKVEGAKLV